MDDKLLLGQGYDHTEELCLGTRELLDELNLVYHTGKKSCLTPTEEIEFLGFKPHAKQAFLEHHGDLLTPEFWTRLKKRLAAGETLEVLPYTVKSWSEYKGGTLVPAQRPA